MERWLLLEMLRAIGVANGKSRCLPRMSFVAKIFNIFCKFVIKVLTFLDTNLQLRESTFTDVTYAGDTALMSIIFENFLYWQIN